MGGWVGGWVLKVCGDVHHARFLFIGWVKCLWLPRLFAFRFRCFLSGLDLLLCFGVLNLGFEINPLPLACS